ncbi:MAG: hypothetical protein ACLGI6_13510, partial [Gammaproteobacteria bacterium]
FIEALGLQPQQRMSTDQRGSNVLQRKLVAGRLNVAGENHDESKTQREAERALAANVVKGKYWTEGQFLYKPSAARSFFTGEKARLADRPILKISFFIKALPRVSALADVIDGLAPPPPTLDLADLLGADAIPLKLEPSPVDIDASASSDSALSETQSNSAAARPVSEPRAMLDQLVREYFETVAEVQIMLRALNTDAELAMLSDTEAKAADAVSVACRSLRLALVSIVALSKNNPGSEFDQASYVQLQGLATQASNSVHELLDAAQSIFKGSLEDTSKARSNTMHEAANFHADLPGVWKIGDRHVSHLIAEKDRKYNLLSKEQFQAELQKASGGTANSSSSSN